MRILIANNFYAPHVVGGAELSVQGIAEQLSATGNDVSVLTTGLRDEDSLLNGVAVYRRRLKALMPYQVHVESRRSLKKMVNKVLTVDNFANAKTIREVLEQCHAEAVLSNNLLGLTPRLWREAHRLGIPVMHTTRDYALLCPNSTLVCKRRSFCEGSVKVPCEAMRTYLRLLTAYVGMACAPSLYTLNMHTSHGFFPRSRTCVIANAVVYDPHRLARIVKERARKVEDGPLRVVYLGRLTEEKGVLTLLEAVRKFTCDEVELHFAGVGPLQETLNRYKQEGMPIVPHGFLAQEDVSSLLEHCDVLVAPSQWPEPFGRIVLDAYAHAMPAIVSRVGGLPEVVGENAGKIVNPRDAEGLYIALEEYVRNRKLVREQGIAASKLIGQHTVEHQANSFLEELRRLVN